MRKSTAFCRTALLAAIIILVTISTARLSAQSPTVLQGTVSDRNTGAPLAGVAILLSPQSGGTRTDANGNYSLTAQQVNNSASGNLYFQLAGYFAAVTPFNITTSPTTLNFSLLPGGTLIQGT